MLPEFPDARPLALADRSLVERHLQEHPRETCEFSFVNLFIWQDFDRPKLGAIEGDLCIRIDPLDEPPFFLEPVGNGTAAAAAARLLREGGRISRASRDFIERLPAGSYRASHLRDHDDYIYRVQDLAELSGRRFDGKRNHIKAFRRNHPRFECVPLEASHRSEAFRLFEAWCRAKRANGGAVLPALAWECQRQALSRAFDAYDELGLTGCGIAVDGTFSGFLIASRLTEALACVHLEYHAPAVQGIAQTLFQEACRTILAPFALVNLEQDLGIAGLRRHKESYYPLRRTEKFDIEAYMQLT